MNVEKYITTSLNRKYVKYLNDDYVSLDIEIIALDVFFAKMKSLEEDLSRDLIKIRLEIIDYKENTSNEKKYERAKNLYEYKRYENAIELYDNLKGYKDSYQLKEKCIESIIMRENQKKQDEIDERRKLRGYIFGVGIFQVIVAVLYLSFISKQIYPPINGIFKFGIGYTVLASVIIPILIFLYPRYSIKRNYKFLYPRYSIKRNYKLIIIVAGILFYIIIPFNFYSFYDLNRNFLPPDYITFQYVASHYDTYAEGNYMEFSVHNEINKNIEWVHVEVVLYIDNEIHLHYDGRISGPFNSNEFTTLNLYFEDADDEVIFTTVEENIDMTIEIKSVKFEGIKEKEFDGKIVVVR